MNNTSFFDKKKRELSNNSNGGQDTQKQREASSLELSFERASDGDVFKDSLKSEDCLLILKRWKMLKRKWKNYVLQQKTQKKVRLKVNCSW